MKKYKRFSGKSETEARYDIKLSKLFHKHISNNEEYTNILRQKHPNRKTKKVLNIYITIPSKLTKLLEIDAFELHPKYSKYTLIDGRFTDKKGSTVFENTRVKDDLFDFMLLLKPVVKEAESKVCVVTNASV